MRAISLPWNGRSAWSSLRQEDAPATAVYKKTLTLHTWQAEIYHNLCWVYLSTHWSLDAAESLIQQALARNPTPRFWSLDTQAVILRRQGKHARALTSLEAVVVLTPSSAPQALPERDQLLVGLYRCLGRN
jgi:tetratricopeptide (TPR) repeat protein